MMTTVNDLRIMNDTLINYYLDYEPRNEKKILKHKIIKEVLKIDNCFKKITKEEAIKILEDIGIKETKLENIYQELYSSSN